MIELARELGLALANSSEFVCMKQAQSIFEQNEAIGALMAELNDKRDRLITILTSDDENDIEAVSLTNDIDRNSLPGQRQSHQQTSQKLAGNVAADLDHTARLDKRWVQLQRRIALIAKISDIGTKLPQGIDQITNRPLVHARHALEGVLTACKRQSRSQWTKGRTSIAQKQIR